MGFKFDDLPEETKQKVRKADGSVPAACPDGSSADPAGASARKTKIPGPKMNTWERQYAKRLRDQLAAGLIAGFWSQGITLRLADDTRYTPDFAVMLAHNQLLFVEVKGFKREDAIVKFKVAAEQYADLGAFVMVSREGQGWKELMRYERRQGSRRDAGEARGRTPPDGAGAAAAAPRGGGGVAGADRSGDQGAAGRRRGKAGR